MDRTVSASEANQHFSEILREVAQGGSVTVTSRGRPVARIVPVDHEGQQRKIKKLLEFLRTQPVRYAGPWTRDDLYE